MLSILFKMAEISKDTVRKYKQIHLEFGTIDRKILQ